MKRHRHLLASEDCETIFRTGWCHVFALVLALTARRNGKHAQIGYVHPPELPDFGLHTYAIWDGRRYDVDGGHALHDLQRKYGTSNSTLVAESVIPVESWHEITSPAGGRIGPQINRWNQIAASSLVPGVEKRAMERIHNTGRKFGFR